MSNASNPERTGRRKTPGMAPGTLVYTGVDTAKAVAVDHIDYSADHLDQGELSSISDCYPLFRTESVTWVDVQGLADVELVAGVAEHVGLHRLVAEDIVSTSQRPKIEPYPKNLYIVLRMLSLDKSIYEVRNEQVSLVLGENFVLSFQERAGDVFDPVRTRLRASRGMIRSRGADYLAYALIDAVVDHYFVVAEGLGDRLDELEMEVLSTPQTDTVRSLHHLKRQLISVRRAVWPLREVLSSMTRDDSKLVSAETRLFLRDVHDHAVQVGDTIESLRDVASGVMDLHLSSVSNRMNEVMKVLTVMSSIFIPLSFLTGLYGMNFNVMPELQVSWGYPALLVFMACTAVGLLLFFRKRDWL